MNAQAALKTLLVVLGIGALTGYQDWHRVYGGTPDERAQRNIAQCISERDMADYRAHPNAGAVRKSKERLQWECEEFVNGSGLALGTASSSGAMSANGTPARSAVVAKAKHSANPPPSPRDLCLRRIEEARSRSPGGLNPEWEQGERNRCEML